MSEPLGLQPSGVAATATVIGRRVQSAVASELIARLQVGMQVELIPTRSLGPDLIEAQLRPLVGSATWTNDVRVQLTAALPAKALQATSGEGTAAGTPPPLRAEVVATGSTLILKLLPPADRSVPTTGSNPTALAGSREWLRQQFRQYWPESRPLAATLENIKAQLARAIGPDQAVVPKPLMPPAPPPEETTGPIQIQHAVTTLIDHLVSATDLTDPERLLTAVSRSGLWLEALLARTAMDPAWSSELKLDLKAQLLMLAQRLRVQTVTPPSASPTSHPAGEQRANAPPPTPQPRPQPGVRPEPAGASTGNTPSSPEGTPRPHGTRTRDLDAPDSGPPSNPDSEQSAEARRLEQPHPRTAGLAREVEGMIKQVVTKQLQSLEGPGNQTQWALEIPFRTPSGLQALEVDIRRQQSGEANQHETWSLCLRLDLPRLGPLNIWLTLRHERLNASFQSGHVDGASQIRQHLSDLRRRLEAHEIQVASLQAGYRPLERPAPPFTDSLVREQA